MITEEKLKSKETLKAMTKILDDQGFDDTEIVWIVEDNVFKFRFHLYDASFFPYVQQFEIRGVCNSVPQPRTHRWREWFQFDETDISYRKIDVDWWRKHKPVLQEIASEFERPVSADPEETIDDDEIDPEIQEGLKKLAAGFVRNTSLDIGGDMFQKLSMDAKLVLIYHNICALANEFKEEKKGWYPANPDENLKDLAGVTHLTMKVPERFRYDQKSSPQYIKFKRLQMMLNLPEYQVIGILESLTKLIDIHFPNGSMTIDQIQELIKAIEWGGSDNNLRLLLKDAGWLIDDGEKLTWCNQ